MVIVSKKFNMPVGSLVQSVAGYVYETGSMPYTAKDGRTVVDAVSYEDNRSYELFPEMLRAYR